MGVRGEKDPPHAKWLSPDLNYGRLDTYQAVNAWFKVVKTRK